MSLEILDVNDNAPEFPTASLVRELIESSPVGTAITIDSATDRDTTQFGVERYELVPDDEPAAAHFQLKVCHSRDKCPQSRELKLPPVAPRPEKFQKYHIGAVHAERVVRNVNVTCQKHFKGGAVCRRYLHLFS